MKRKRRISGLGDTGSVAMSLLPIVGGVLLAKVLDKQIFKGAEYSNIAKLGIGVLGAAMTKGAISQLAAGVAIDGAVQFVAPALQKAGAINLLAPGMPSRYVAGIPDPTGELVIPGAPLGF